MEYIVTIEINGYGFDSEVLMESEAHALVAELEKQDIKVNLWQLDENEYSNDDWSYLEDK